MACVASLKGDESAAAAPISNDDAGNTGWVVKMPAYGSISRNRGERWTLWTAFWTIFAPISPEAEAIRLTVRHLQVAYEQCEWRFVSACAPVMNGDAIRVDVALKPLSHMIPLNCGHSNVKLYCV